MPAPSYSLFGDELRKKLEFKETLTAEAGVEPQHLNEKNIQGMEQATRGAQIAAASGIDPKTMNVEDLKRLDPVKPVSQDETPQDKEAQNNMTKVVSSVLPTLIGLGLGGAVGGAAMARGTAMGLQMEAEQEQKNKVLAQEKQIKMAELAEKGEHRKFEERKLAQDKELKMAEIAANRQAKATERSLAMEKTNFDRAAKLRDDYLGNNLTKKTQEVSQAFAKIQEVSAQEPSAAGDISMVYNFMRMQDPGSTVREGEFATAQNAAGIPDRIRNLYNKAVSGERLNPEQRADFSNRARDIAIAQTKQQEVFDKQFSGLASKYGIKPEEVVVRFGQPQEQALSQERLTAQQSKQRPGMPKGDVMGGQKAFAAPAVDADDRKKLEAFIKANPNDPKAARAKQILGM